MDALPSLRTLVSDRWLYRDAHYLACDVALDAAAVRRWLPWPLVSAARGVLFTAWFPETNFGSTYAEAGLFVEVRGPRRARAVHVPWIVVDDDVALVAGRALGYPKKLGTIAWHLDGDRIDAAASRRGTELVRMRGTLGPRIAAPPPIIGRPHRNLAFGFATPRIVAFTPRERVREVRAASLEVTIGSSPRDPLGELGLRVLGTARLHRVDIGIPRVFGLPRPAGFAIPRSFADIVRRCA